MMLSTKGRYAVMAMVDLATQPQDKPVGLAAIADRQEIPLAYLEQIFAKLKRAGIVTSSRGPGGGYRLGKDAARISIVSIINASEEDISITRCHGAGSSGCMQSTKARCVTHDLWDGLERQIEHYLGNLSLADVCGRKVQEKFPAPTMFAEIIGGSAHA
jgi:Rrf2 family iron-sulfur cluster assembly transcriptional regulator